MEDTEEGLVCPGRPTAKLAFSVERRIAREGKGERWGRRE